MKVTVEQFLNSGFEFIKGDKYESKGSGIVIVGIDVHEWWANSSKLYNHELFINYLTHRPNLGTQPVGDDCVIEITYNNELIKECKANDKRWHKYGGGYEIKSWKPSLKHLEQQMNDNQESAMNISERDIENAFIKQEDAEVERELSESDDLPDVGSMIDASYIAFEGDDWTDFHPARVISYDDKKVWLRHHDKHDRIHEIINVEFKEQLTPEQLAAKERDEWIDNVCNEICISDDYIIGLMYDAGYRK